MKVGVIMAAFKDVLRYLRESENLKQEELAEKVGVSYAAISNYETGKREPKRKTLEAIADYFNVDMNYLLGKTSIQRVVTFDSNGNRIYSSNTLTERQQKLLDSFNALNEDGQRKVLEYIGDLSDRYRSTSL